MIERVKILITGDFCPNHRLTGLNAHSIDKEVFGDLLHVIREADIAITNLECPITDAEKPIIKTGPALKGKQDSVSFLKISGFDMVTLANNHIMDYGTEGLKDTLKVLQSEKVEYVGAGNDLTQASEVKFKEINDITIAFVNAAENEWSTTHGDYPGANPLEPVHVFRLIQKAKARADKVILITHGGHEMYELPSPRMKQLYRGFADMGVDAVINHHTHCISGYEVYNGTPIFYSLGNFLFDNPNKRNSIWNYGAALQLHISKETIDFELKYFEQCNDKASIELLTGKQLIDLEAKILELNETIKNDAELNKQFELFVCKSSKMYNSYLEPVKNRVIQALQNRGLFPSFWHKRKRIYLLNLVRCESHREAIVEILNKQIKTGKIDK